MSRKFMSLQEFLALRDPYDGREYAEYRTAEQWLRFFEVAKRSYETYGGAGPPEGSVIITLRAGFAGGGLNRRILGGTLESDERCLVVLVPINDYEDERRCLASKEHWWREFYVEEQHEEGLHNRTGLV